MMVMISLELGSFDHYNSLEGNDISTPNRILHVQGEYMYKHYKTTGNNCDIYKTWR